MIYFIILSIFLLFGLFTLIDTRKNSLYIWAFISFLVVIFFGGLRYQVGVDWYNYQSIFLESKFDDLVDSDIEPLFNLLNVVIKYLNLDYHLFVFLVFSISTILKFKFFLKYSSSFFVALLVYFPIQFMTYDINGIRQGLAIGIIFWSIEFILKRNFFKFFIIVLVATSFHYSAAIFLPFYFIANMKFRGIYIHTIIISSIILGFILQDSLLAFLMPKLSGFDTVFSQKVSTYSENDNFGKGISFGFSSIHRLIIFYLFYYFYDKINVNKALKNILLNAYFISIVLYFLFSAIEIIAARGSLYYRSFDILIIASFITIPSKLKERLLILTAIFLYSVFGLISNLNLPFNGLIPYDNILFTY